MESDPPPTRYCKCHGGERYVVAVVRTGDGRWVAECGNPFPGEQCDLQEPLHPSDEAIPMQCTECHDTLRIFTARQGRNAGKRFRRCDNCDQLRGCLDGDAGSGDDTPPIEAGGTDWGRQVSSEDLAAVVQALGALQAEVAGVRAAVDILLSVHASTI